VPGALELAKKQKSFVGGDDFKSGQTKLKSVLMDFLVSAGIKPVSIVSYNHLGNNDGYNLSAPQQFRSKEVYNIKKKKWKCMIYLIFIYMSLSLSLSLSLSPLSLPSLVIVIEVKKSKNLSSYTLSTNLNI